MNNVAIISAIGIAVLIIGLFALMQQTPGTKLCFDACGPCSSYGSLYVMKNGKCVLPENTTRNLSTTVTIDKNFSVPITEPFEYDDLCRTQFWTETTNKPEQRYVSSLLQEQLKERLDWHISNDKITFWNENEEFVVTIPGNWQGRDAPIIVVKETLERIEGITHVKDIIVACA